MKKTYFFGFALMISGLASAQLPAETSATVHQLKTDFTNEPVSHPGILSADRNGGDVIWQNDFSSSSNWLAGAPGGAGAAPEFGWSIGSTTNSWAGTMAADMNTTGNFARFRNGTTTTAHQGGPFTFTFDSTFNLAGIPAPSIQFEQYGARFITLQAVQVSTDGGTTWVTVGDNNDIPPLTSGGGSLYPRPMTRSFNISAAIAGNEGNVRIRFFWDGAMNGPSMNYVDYGWYIDNVRIVEGYNYDIQNEETFHRSGVGTIYPQGMEYYMIPVSQLTPITFIGNCSNQGAATHTGAALNVQVTNGSVVYTGSSAGTSLAPNSTDSMVATATFTPANGIGIYTIEYWFDGTNPEDITNNDTTYDAIEVTQNIYARDNGVATGSISAVTSSPEGVLQIGNVFEIFNAGVIGGANVRISSASTNTGQAMYVYLYRFDAGVGDYVLERESDDYFIQSSDLNNFIEFQFSESLAVSPGDDILLVAGHYGGTSPVGFSYAQTTDEGTVLGYIDGSAFQLTSPEAIMIRLNMQDFTGIEENNASSFTIGQNVPNPFNNTSVITYTLTETSNVSVQITDVTGKVVQTITPGTLEAGTYSMTIDAATMADGLYFYTFTVGDNIVTNQMVVSKN